MDDPDLLVIGGGAGGISAAQAAAQLFFDIDGRGHRPARG